ncbi:hypothetical protein Q5P01_023966 [Channa striata]|uniref:Uncharacterized protein n=1 Tax=Channa striata TaxID=64152 RepID=A0AA88IXD4_CHASR|nr:hypothetical protein Q5P01_023966 [Channa striata]
MGVLPESFHKPMWKGYGDNPGGLCLQSKTSDAGHWDRKERVTEAAQVGCTGQDHTGKDVDLNQSRWGVKR